MIFLTIGSHEPFDRLVKAVDAWAAVAKPSQLFGQITSNGTYRPQNFEFVPYLDPDAFNAHILNARLIIAHAGMGSIISAVDTGKPIVIMPRRGHLNETRNDHQYATAKKFAGKPGIHFAEDENVLAGTINRALSMSQSGLSQPVTHFAQTELLDFLRNTFSR